MLYNKSWDEKQTPEQLLELQNVTKWLEQQPPWKGYVYLDGSRCLLAKYFRAHGYDEAICGPEDVYLDGSYSGEIIEIPIKMYRVLYGSISFMGWRSFRGALKQARLVLENEERAYAL